MLYCDAIIDLQSGDTGKGKIAHSLCKSGEYDLVMRYNGGSNAGHTIYHNGQKFVTHQVPAGVFYGIRSLIGIGCVVHEAKLMTEIQELNALGIKTEGLIFVDYRAHAVLNGHVEVDSKDVEVGTTGQGIGPAYRDKYNRSGFRISDLSNGTKEFKLIDSLDLLREAKTVLAEGAQGFKLDIDWGDYPYVTSSHCTIGSVVLNGIPPQKIRRVIGVLKAYETYVGHKEFGFVNAVSEEIVRHGNEIGSTTGRTRKIDWINLDEVEYAIEVNGVTELIVNKLDILEKVGKFGYKENGVVTFCSSGAEFEWLLRDAFNLPIAFSRSPYDI